MDKVTRALELAKEIEVLSTEVAKKKFELATMLKTSEHITIPSTVDKPKRKYVFSGKYKGIFSRTKGKKYNTKTRDRRGTEWHKRKLRQYWHSLPQEVKAQRLERLHASRKKSNNISITP